MRSASTNTSVKNVIFSQICEKYRKQKSYACFFVQDIVKFRNYHSTSIILLHRNNITHKMFKIHLQNSY